MTDDDLFWSMVEPEEYPCDCRLWLGDWNDSGYGTWWGPSIYGPYGDGKVRVNRVVAYKFAYNRSPWKPEPVEQVQDAEWCMREICGIPHPKPPKMHISHLCGLAPCCNALHLMPITPTQNGKDMWLHRQMLQAISEPERAELRASGMGFKEIARTFDIPGGIAFKVLYGKLRRQNYPVPVKTFGRQNISATVRKIEPEREFYMPVIV